MAPRLLTAKEVRAIYGDVSQMTLWRWLNDKSLGFPRPTVIRNRRYWDAAEIEGFRARMISAGIDKSAA